MIRRIILILSVSFLVFFVSLYFYNIKEKKINEYINQVEQINFNIEKTYLSWIKNIKIEDNEEELDKQKLIENMIAENLADIDNVIALSKNESKDLENLKYKKLYMFYISRQNIDLAIKAILNILQNTDNKEIWYKKLVDLYIQTWQFKLAEEYAKKLLEIEWTKENLKNYMYIRFQNINFFDKLQISWIKNLIYVLHEKKVLDEEDLKFYNFLIDLLSDWNIENLEKNISVLVKDMKNDTNKNLLVNIKNEYEIYNKSKWSPLYYFKSLVALNLLKFWYFWLAKNVAENIYIQDSSYILPQQILAYSYFFMWNYENAIKYFQILKKADINFPNDYNFFLWVSYYRLKKQQNALLYLTQLNWTYPYYKDVLRYTLLSYMELKDDKNIKEIIYKLSKYELSYVDYYNIFKYLLFECEDCYKNQLKTLVSLIISCYKDVQRENQYVCWYWKWNLFLKAWKKELAVQYFKLLSNYFQDTYIYHTLATYYEDIKDIHQARIYYLKEFLYTEDEQQRSILEEKMREIFMNR